MDRDGAPQRRNESHHWHAPVMGITVQMLALGVRVCGTDRVLLVFFIGEGAGREIDYQGESGQYQDTGLKAYNRRRKGPGWPWIAQGQGWRQIICYARAGWRP